MVYLNYGRVLFIVCTYLRLVVVVAALMLVSVSVFVAAFIKYTLCHYHARSHSVNAHKHPEKCHFPSKKMAIFCKLMTDA